MRIWWMAGLLAGVLACGEDVADLDGTDGGGVDVSQAAQNLCAQLCERRAGCVPVRPPVSTTQMCIDECRTGLPTGVGQVSQACQPTTEGWASCLANATCNQVLATRGVCVAERQRFAADCQPSPIAGGPTDATDMTDSTDMTDATDATDSTDATDATDSTDMTDSTDTMGCEFGVDLPFGSQCCPDEPNACEAAAVCLLEDEETDLNLCVSPLLTIQVSNGSVSVLQDRFVPVQSFDLFFIEVDQELFVSLETFQDAGSLSCPLPFDTLLLVLDETGEEATANDDKNPDTDRCSLATAVLQPGLYEVFVTDFDSDEALFYDIRITGTGP
jgi:hypothetical protein